MLTAPPPQDNTEGTTFEAQRNGSELLFFWSTCVIRRIERTAVRGGRALLTSCGGWRSAVAGL